MGAVSFTVEANDLLTKRNYAAAFNRTMQDNFQDGIILDTSGTPLLETSQAIQIANPELVYLKNRYTVDNTSKLEIGIVTTVYDITLYPGEGMIWPLNGLPTTITLFVRGQSADMEWEYYAWTRRV